MSYIEPNLGQVQQNKKILQELEEKKRRMRNTGNKQSIKFIKLMKSIINLTILLIEIQHRQFNLSQQISIFK